MNVVLISGAKAYFVKTMEVTSNSGDQYLALLKEVKEKVEAKGLIVCAAVGDNATGVQNALARYVVLCDFPC